MKLKQKFLNDIKNAVSTSKSFADYEEKVSNIFNETFNNLYEIILLNHKNISSDDYDCISDFLFDSDFWFDMDNQFSGLSAALDAITDFFDSDSRCKFTLKNGVVTSELIELHGAFIHPDIINKLDDLRLEHKELTNKMQEEHKRSENEAERAKALQSGACVDIVEYIENGVDYKHHPVYGKDARQPESKKPCLSEIFAEQMMA